jgi:ankyrin repeat protein
MIERICAGRTDLVFDYVAQGNSARSTDQRGTSLIKWCAYYGDVSAIRFLLSQGETLKALGDNFDLNGAAFHRHWRLCEFLVEQGADANHPLHDTGETPLHAAFCRPGDLEGELVTRVLLKAGANPNRATKAGIETGGFMRDVRTRGETPLHRAAAFGSEAAIQQLLDAGAAIDAKDAHGDTALSWASWYRRPIPILRKLCFGRFSIQASAQPMENNLLGAPHP